MSGTRRRVNGKARGRSTGRRHNGTVNVRRSSRTSGGSLGSVIHTILKAFLK